MNKSKNQVFHAKRRAVQRLDLELNRVDIKEIIKMIQNQKTLFLEKQSFRISKHRVKYKEKEFDLIYDKERKTIVTIMPTDWHQNEA